MMNARAQVLLLILLLFTAHRLSAQGSIMARLPSGQAGGTVDKRPLLPGLESPDAPGDEGKKSVAAGAAYSLLLPGMGELYAGNYSSGKYFTIAEGVLWVALGSVTWYASWIQEDARTFAVQHAGIVQKGQSDQYFSDIGNFDNTYQYNEEILRERQAYKTYDPQSYFAWNWDSGVNRQQYRALRVSSDEMYNDTRFIGAAIIVNHLASAINAARLVISHNKQVDQSSTFDFHADVIGGFAHPSGILLSFSKTF
jgi:hypothetical protein